MTATASLRRASGDDSHAVAQLVRHADLPTLGLDQAWATFVAEDAAGLAGVAALERYEGLAGPAFLLRSVAVRADRRGSGLGAALVHAALAAADQDTAGRATVGLLTETAAGYFERFGFVEVARGDLPPSLSASPELTTLCPASARAYLRR
jgi:amino-acid N-acetyltransferase